MSNTPFPPGLDEETQKQVESQTLGVHYYIKNMPQRCWEDQKFRDFIQQVIQAFLLNTTSEVKPFTELKDLEKKCGDLTFLGKQITRLYPGLEGALLPVRENADQFIDWIMEKIFEE